MASEYHKWVARNEQREEPKELTRQERWKNWWYYWKYVLLGVVAVMALAFIAKDIIDNKANQPDCQITYIGTNRLPNDTVVALQEQLKPLIGDADGNGKVIIKVRQYTVDNENYASDDPSQQMAMMAHLSSNENLLFLLENPEAFQRKYGLLTLPDGTSPDREVAEALWYAWGSCPVLAELPLRETMI